MTKATFKIDNPFESKEKKAYDPWADIYFVDPELAEPFLVDSTLELIQDAS